jgi:predicted AAA+ superfamily ATPase
MAKEQRQTTNLAAEFFVASQLFRLGYIVTVTYGNTKEIDILVANPNGKKVSIDVKGLKNKTNWPLKPKLKRKDHFYVLVSYVNKYSDPDVTPEIFVVPSLEVSKILGRWSGNPNVTGVPYTRVKGSKYENGWHLLFK